MISSLVVLASFYTLKSLYDQTNISYGCAEKSAAESDSREVAHELGIQLILSRAGKYTDGMSHE